MDKDQEQLIDLNISDEYAFKPDGRMHYGVVRMMSDAYFRIPAGFTLEIETLYNEKDYELTDNPYDFLVRTPDGKNGDEGENGQNAPTGGPVQIIIHKLVNTVRLKGIGGNGGNGGDGRPGADGGDGGDAKGTNASGGTGGNGSNGGNGGNGGNGACGPVICVDYTPVGKAKLIVLSRENKPCRDNLAYGGLGGKGGKQGERGSGGKGGLNGDGKTRASEGSPGSLGNPGNPGNDGSDVPVVIHRRGNDEQEGALCH